MPIILLLSDKKPVLGADTCFFQMEVHIVLCIQLFHFHGRLSEQDGGLIVVMYFIIIIIIVYLYSAQYLHILQDPERYLTHSTVLSTAQLSSYWHSPNWKTEAQGWPLLNVPEGL